jgi:hypothetical protein
MPLLEVQQREQEVLQYLSGELVRATTWPWSGLIKLRERKQIFYSDSSKPASGVGSTS